MNSPISVIINNLASITFIQQREWKISKLSEGYFFIKILLVIPITFIMNFFPDIKIKYYKKSNVELKNLSLFSKSVFFMTLNCIHVCALLVVILQFAKRKKVLIFLEKISSLSLPEKLKKKFDKNFKFNAFINIFLFVTCPLIRTLTAIRNDLFISYAIGSITIQTHIFYFVFLNLICNIQSLIVFQLKDIKNNLMNCAFNSNYHRLLGIEIIRIDVMDDVLREFEEVFGTQLTIATTAFTISTVLLVRKTK
jgi:hypothetical protein